jgi:hypothetical protein
MMIFLGQIIGYIPRQSDSPQQVANIQHASRLYFIPIYDFCLIHQ